MPNKNRVRRRSARSNYVSQLVAAGIAPTGSAANGTLRVPVPARRPALDGWAFIARLLASYLQGWAEADPVRIAEATAPEYHFDDPFVGIFPASALPRYFEAVQSRADLGGLVSREHLSFALRGPMDTSSAHGDLQFWREAPRLGLTGTSHIAIGPGGVTSERVAYDLNMASEQLRQPRRAEEPRPCCAGSV